MNSCSLSQEESLINLKKELDDLGFDHNNLLSFASGQPDVCQHALTLIDSYLENFNNCGIALLCKKHLRTCSPMEKGRHRSENRLQSSITSFFFKGQKTEHPLAPITETPADGATLLPTAESEVVVPISPIAYNPISTEDGLERDPGMRNLIHSQSVSEETLIDKYLELGPFQPRLSKYPVDLKTCRSFSASWFQRFAWLEYSIANDNAFCFVCYLFSLSKQTARSSSQFITCGFKQWKNALEKNKGLIKHNNSIDHTDAIATMERRKAKVLPCILSRLDGDQKSAQAAQVVATAKVVLHLALQGLAFRSHQESHESLNRGNFLETLDFLVHNESDLRKSITCLPKNAKYTSPDVQKEMTKAVVDIVRQTIREELGDGYFCLVADEARCEARKEWMSVVLRFVDQHGEICERFAGAIHVEDTRFETLFQHLLGFVPFAFYVHCFTHRLNLVIVAVATEVHSIAQFFCLVQHIFNICGASCKRNDALRSSHAEFIQKAIELGDVVIGKGQNQMRSLGSISSTRWNCRLSALKTIANLFSAICDVLEMVAEDAVAPAKRVEADHLLEKVSSFEFAFGLMLMTEVLTVTNTLSISLQKKDQDLVNACAMIKSAKLEIQSIRDEGFPRILDRSVAFSFLHGIVVLPLDEQWQPSGRRMRGRPPQSRELSYKDHYRLEVFIPVLDQLRSELDCRFSETVGELMDLASCLQPNDNFHRFYCQKILRLAKVYSEDFSDVDRLGLESELRSFKSTLISHPDFGIELKSIADLLPIVIKSGLSVNFPLCTRLIRLILTLPVSTATTERTFSALKIVKTRLRTLMGDSWLVDLLTIYIEKGIARNIPIDSVVSGFNAMKSRRV
ncbi:uncharacterized protein LOC144708786 [Wolffia australiana]